MKVVVALDKFKGSITSNEANNAVEKGIRNVYPDAFVIKVPIADGGDGTVQSLVDGLGGEIIEKTVTGPLMKPVVAKYGILPDKTAVIEMASASGLALLTKEERNPLKTTTFGVGELIKDAIRRGCRDFIIGIGGSATNDAGIGMLNALGYRFYDEKRQELPGVGESLSKIKGIDSSQKLAALSECRFLVACDVDNPLYGKNGAAFVYARQKGASDEMIVSLDQGLRNFATVVLEQLHIDVNISGAGAAGGLGGGISALLNGTLKPGVEIIFNKINIEEKAIGANFLITGEGRMDFQSVMGKAPMGVAKLGKKLGIPVIGVSGSVMEDAYKLHDYGISAIFSIMNSPMTLEEAMDRQNAMKLVEATSEEIFRIIKLKE